MADKPAAAPADVIREANTILNAVVTAADFEEFSSPAMRQRIRKAQAALIPALSSLLAERDEAEAALTKEREWRERLQVSELREHDQRVESERVCSTQKEALERIAAARPVRGVPLRDTLEGVNGIARAALDGDTA